MAERRRAYRERTRATPVAPSEAAATLAHAIHASCATRITLNSARLALLPRGSDAYAVAENDTAGDIAHFAHVEELDLVRCATDARAALGGDEHDEIADGAPPRLPPPGTCVCAACGVRDPLDDYGGSAPPVVLSDVHDGHWIVAPPAAVARLAEADSTVSLRQVDGSTRDVACSAFRHLHRDPNGSRTYHVLAAATWSNPQNALCARLCKWCRPPFTRAAGRAQERQPLQQNVFCERYGSAMPGGAYDLYAANAPEDTFAAGDDFGTLMALSADRALLQLSTLEELMLATHRVRCRHSASLRRSLAPSRARAPSGQHLRMHPLAVHHLRTSHLALACSSLSAHPGAHTQRTHASSPCVSRTEPPRGGEAQGARWHHVSRPEVAIDGLDDDLRAVGLAGWRARKRPRHPRWRDRPAQPRPRACARADPPALHWPQGRGGQCALAPASLTASPKPYGQACT